MRPIFDDRLQWPIVTTVATVTTVLQRAIVLPPSSSQSAFQPADHSMGPPKRYEFVTAALPDGKSRPEKFTSLIPNWKFI